MKKFLANLTAILLLGFVLSSCSAFQSKQKINLAPFAENAVSIVSDIEYGLSKGRAIHTREFIGGPKSIAYKQQWQRMGKFLRGIVGYSIQLVTISQSDMSDSHKSEALAVYIAGLAGPAFEDTTLGFQITRKEFNYIVDNIRKQSNYFKAMNAAQPVVDEVARMAKLVLIDLKNAQEEARLEVADRIEKYHEPVLKYRNELKLGVDMVLQSAVFLADWKEGKPNIEDSLLTHNPGLKEYLKPGQTLTYKTAATIKKSLAKSLEGGQLIQAYIYPELEQYQKEMHELDDLIAISTRGIKQSKAAIAIWRRSHQTMASGITEPAAIDLFGIAQAALKKVAPIP